MAIGSAKHFPKVTILYITIRVYAEDFVKFPDFYEITDV